MKRASIGFCLLSSIAFAAGCGDSSPSGPSGAPPPTGGVGSMDPSLTAPTLEEPATGEALKDLQPEVVVGNATGGSGTRTYTVELALDSAFQQMALSDRDIREGLGGITRWQISEPLQADTRYYWRARASTSAGVGPYSSVSEFRIREAYSLNRPSGDLVVFDPLTTGDSVGQVMGGLFVEGGWQPQRNTDCLRYQVPTLAEGQIEFVTTNLSTPNPVSGKRHLVSMWDPTKGEYTINPFRMHLQKLDRSTAAFDDVRLRWISRGQEHNTGISFYDFEPHIEYDWRIEWGTFPGIRSQHVKVFLQGLEILNRNYDPVYHPKVHWIELGQCERKETLEMAIYSNVRIGSR